MGRESVEKLKIFVDSIKKQSIYLVKLSFLAKDEIISISMDETSLNHDFKIEISGVKETKIDNRNFIIVSLDYNFVEKIFWTKRKKQLLRMHILYKLNLFLELNNKSESLVNDKEIILNYANSSGLLTVFPYIRYLADHIHKELRLGLEPYPPMKIKLDV